ncbi:hypothetical protein PNK_0314 [Candidatus Protochlamydia naegleriophila]|uniref:Secreted protein n=1 Tax=Candidatus Protochlamydia naegleriophila TaxID=389348 RepID=A0A0U5JC43_9BACT|nr:hypothetical protein [Candidatus Protochlamydia naegleriophila]CUI15951.1 hypothetical protein PNK_0314 [Candidatus Protochlamydia naegleriophila]
MMKYITKGLLVGLMFVPFTTQAVVDEPLIHQEDLEGGFEAKRNPFLSKRKTIEWRHQVIGAFEKLEADLHDVILLSFYNTTFPFPSNLLINDALDIGVLLSAIENLNGVEFTGLLVNFTAAGFSYASSTTSFCTTPNNRNELISQWQSAGLLLADFLISRSPNPRMSERIRDLFLAWTNSQISYIDFAAPQCADPTSPVDAAASNEAYKQTRALTFLVADLVFDVLHK